MNIISSGGKYRVYGESVQTYDKLPTKTYQISFNQLEGFSLVVRNDLEITEEKIYGNSSDKVEKAMKSYKSTNRNFGVLLSGQKGIGKSLFLRLLAKKAIEDGLPVITVTNAYPGVENFISSIDQDCVIVFDEFEKVFSINSEDSSCQDELLSLFDGLDGGHKLFVVTCNQLNRISAYMLDRPGRFHYHFTLSTPKAEEVKEYMTDKLKPEYHHVIQDVVNMANIIEMPYDYLRAIAFDLNQGYSLKETMNDLNISKYDYSEFDVEITLSNGYVYNAYNVDIDIEDKNEHTAIDVRRYAAYRENDNAPFMFTIHFFAGRAKVVNNEFVVDKEDCLPINWHYARFLDDDNDEKRDDFIKRNISVAKIELKKIKNYGNVGKWTDDFN